jgi:hypothetical protein
MPSERKRLSGFVDYGADDEEINQEYPGREAFGEGVITDSDKMASMIRVYFGKIWAKRDGAPSIVAIRQYLQEYGARVPTELHPSFPNRTTEEVCSMIDQSWTELVLGVIRGSNDSCAGPDGVPFAVYRSLPSICCSFLLDIIIDLAKGTKPPEWFNLGRLFLIPKDDSGKVLNHRPITVNNSDNRLVASVLAGVITPACQSIIHHSQKGFIPGRSGDDHIVALTDHYYEAVSTKSPLYELKIDTKKAFDSIDHAFMEEVVRTQGFHGWLIRIILGLYHRAYVSPVLSHHTHVLIPIRRGVKQGCPLSPLIFALCYDPLLVHLSRVSEDGCSPRLYAFADDLNVEASRLQVINACMILIDLFSRISGLGVNHDKSELLCACPPTASIKAQIRRLHWDKVKVVLSFKYLGILMGLKRDNHYLSVDDIFGSPLAKLETRARSMRSLLAPLPLHHRVIGVNVFLLSLFSYHYQFYVPTRRICDRVEKVIRPLLVPFRGSAFRLQTLYLGRGMGMYGLSTPLKELYSLALTAVANRHDLASHHGEPVFSIPGFNYRERTNWRSLSIRVGVCFAAHDLIYITHDNTEGPVCATGWTPHSASTRKALYNTLIVKTWGASLLDPLEVGNHLQKGSRWGLDPPAVDKLRERWTSKDLLAPPYLISHHFRMWMNALPTGERLSKMVGSPLSQQLTRCHLCGADRPPLHLDSTRHMMSGDCTVVSTTRSHFFRAFGITLPLSLSSSFLAHPTDLPSSPRRKVLWLATLFFNWCVYHARRRLFMTRTAPLPMERAVRSLLSYTLTHWNRLTHSTKVPFISRLTVDFTTLKLRRPLRSSVQTPKKKKPTDPGTIAAITSPPRGTPVYFLDGSANPNPGPAGAGAVLFVNGALVSRHSASLGHSTNNVGELYAFGIALTDLYSRLNTGPARLGTPCAYLVTDSEFALKLLQGTAKPHDRKSVCRQ